MAYFNYHAKVKRLIFEDKLTGYEFVDDYNGIKPALVLYFLNERPMPIRDYKWQEYIPILIAKNDKLNQFGLTENKSKIVNSGLISNKKNK